MQILKETFVNKLVDTCANRFFIVPINHFNFIKNALSNKISSYFVPFITLKKTTASIEIIICAINLSICYT